MFYNRTRRSESIPRSLFRRGRMLEVPLYYLLCLSDLAREGMENSGSFRFADHIYRNQPSGRGAFGRWLDARILALRPVQSFRNRYLTVRDELLRWLAERAGRGRLDLLSVPSGIPRELVEAVRGYRDQGRSVDDIRLHALDLDDGVLQEAQDFAKGYGIDLVLHSGDAFDRKVYGGEFDFITSTGFGEFLDDAQLAEFYAVISGQLRPGGVFVTSSMQRRWVSDYLLRLAELRVHYRTSGQLAEIARPRFSGVATWTDLIGIQGFLRAQK